MRPLIAIASGMPITFAGVGGATMPPVDPAGADVAPVDPAGVDPAGVDPAGVDPAGVDATGVDGSGASTPPADAPPWICPAIWHRQIGATGFTFSNCFASLTVAITVPGTTSKSVIGCPIRLRCA